MSDDQYHALELQLQHIVDQLARELGTDSHQGSLSRRLTEISSNVEQLRQHILGTPSFPGLALRLDRLEVAEKNRAKLASAVLLSIVGLLLKAVWELIAR